MTYRVPPLVTIIMPSLNQVQFLGDAIKSVVTQDYEKLELIIIDGGSTDGTLDLLAQRKKSEPRLRFYSDPDDGPADALNKGFSKARGTILGWLNADDLFAANAISRAMEIFSANSDLVMVYGHGQHIDHSGKVIGDYPTKTPATEIEQFREGCFICQPTVFMTRTARFLLGELDTSLKTAFDFDYWLRAFTAFTGRIGFVDEVQAYSRLHNDCITRRMRQEVAIEGMQVIARHLGNAPGHWLLTYVNEALDGQTNSTEISAINHSIREAFDAVAPLMLPAEMQSIQAQITANERLSIDWSR